jgi:radical SAM protein with 4Fe4S-binding SPASM domain
MPDESHSRFVPPGMTRDCFDPWVYVEFHANGGVSPCCVRRPIGNIRDQPLADILNGSRIRELRHALLSGEPDETCRDCGLRQLISPANLQAKVGMILGSIKMPPGFSAERYLKANPDVKAAGDDPARHFLMWGRLEGRSLEIGRNQTEASAEQPAGANPELPLAAE